MGGVEKGAGATGRGAVLIVCGMAVIGLIDNFVVELGRVGGLGQFHAMRAAMALPVLLIIALLLKVTLRPKNLAGVVARTMCLATSMLLYFASIPQMPIALVVAGLFTSPVFVLLIAALVYRQKVGPVRIFAVAVAFLGGMLILDPTGDEFDPSFLVPVAAGFLYALNVTFTRRYCAEEPTLLMLTWFFVALGTLGAIGGILMSGGMEVAFHLRGWMVPGEEFLFWTAVQAFGSMVGIFLMTRAYQIADPSYLAIFEYSLLIFVSFWAWVLYAQGITMQAALGMCLVVVSGVIIARRSAQG